MPDPEGLPHPPTVPIKPGLNATEEPEIEIEPKPDNGKDA